MKNNDLLYLNKGSPISPLAQEALSEKPHHYKRSSSVPKKCVSDDDMSLVMITKCIVLMNDIKLPKTYNLMHNECQPFHESKHFFYSII